MKVDSILTISLDELSEREWRRLFSKLRYQTDDATVWEPWMVLPHKRVVKMPRGAWAYLPDHVEYLDWRCKPVRRHAIPFLATLDAEGFSGQEKALEAMFAQEQGVIVAQPGFGKTNVALAFVAKCETTALILVHTEDILQQWLERAAAVIPDARIGVMRGKQDEIRDVTFATIQTFKRRLQARGDELAVKFGAVILDECHHAPASTFDQVLNQLPAFYRFGFTATDKRADGRHPYITTVIGPVIYRHKFQSKVPVKVVPVKSHKFYYGYRGQWDWRNLLNALKNDERRNAVIAKLVDREIRRGNSTLVLSREIDHLQNIKLAMQEDAEILAAALLTKDQRKSLLEKFRNGEIKCLLATQLADEALDVPILSRVFLTFPGKHDGRIIQQVGRALREHPLKDRAVIFDVVDDRVGVLRRQWMRRKQAYKSMGIRIKKRRVK